VRDIKSKDATPTRSRFVAIAARETLIEVSRLLGHRDVGITARVNTHFVEHKSTAIQDLASSLLEHAKK
jgi:hypothetical protein